MNKYKEALDRMEEAYYNFDSRISSINKFKEDINLLTGLVNEHFKEKQETNFEFDLLNAYKNSGMRQCISNYGTLLEMYRKGHFKGIDTSTPIREILDNCKVV